MDAHVYPSEDRSYEEVAREQWRPTQVIEELKKKVRGEGVCGTFSLEDSERVNGPGLTHEEYAPLCEIMGRSFIGPEVFNCSAPDTGNLEVLTRYGTAEQKKQWLDPLLEGEIRSCFAVTEPEVASSDETNIEARCAATVRLCDSLLEGAGKGGTTHRHWILHVLENVNSIMRNP
jgi:acyl-CoA dehydrogenase